MKIGIVTVYKSHNCGSFLQAYALKKTLIGMKHDVYFVPYYMFANSFLDVSFQCFKSLLKHRFRLVRFLLFRYIVFRQAICKNFQRCSLKMNCDVFVFGSDTLWNFADPFFFQRKKFFLGLWTKKRKVAFSVSVGSSRYSDFLQDDCIENGLKNFSCISVRDDFSFDFVKKLSKREDVIETIDPTMLLRPEDYSFGKKIPFKKRFIFIYHFGNISKDLANELKTYASSKGIRIVNMGSPNKFADENVVNDPFRFVQYIEQADCVLTNTFHGCIFSILFNKRFVTDGFSKKKIETLLAKFGLVDRALYSDKDFMKKIDMSIDYDVVNKHIEGYRKKSIDFLERSLV